jgi:hypothetical protein
VACTLKPGVGRAPTLMRSAKRTSWRRIIAGPRHVGKARADSNYAKEPAQTALVGRSVLRGHQGLSAEGIVLQLCIAAD